MQTCPRLACEIPYFCRQKYMQFAGKKTGIADKTPAKRRQK